jgi:hypothetical protein
MTRERVELLAPCRASALQPPRAMRAKNREHVEMHLHVSFDFLRYAAIECCGFVSDACGGCVKTHSSLKRLSRSAAHGSSWLASRKGIEVVVNAALSPVATAQTTLLCKENDDG